MTGDAEFDLLEPVRATFRQRHQRHFEAAAFHRQFLHAGGHRGAQSLAGLGARLRQLFRFGEEGFFGFGFGRVQAVEIGCGVERGKLRATRFVFFRQRLGLQAEFARGRVQRVETLFDLGEPVRIEFELLRVVAERIGRFLQLDLGRLQRRQHVVQRRVDLGEVAHLRHDRGEMRDHRFVRFGQRAERPLHAVDQIGRMRQAPVLGVDLFPFARLRRKFVQFGELPGETLALQLQFAVARLRMLDGLNLVAPRPPCPRDGCRGFREAGMGVEQFALRVRTHQQLVRMLPMNIHQHLADFAQLRERRRRAVDERARAAVRIHHATQHHGAAVMAVVGGRAERLLVEPLLDLRMRLEFRGDVGAALAGAHHARIGAGAEREGQRVDQDRLAGACFA